MVALCEVNPGQVGQLKQEAAKRGVSLEQAKLYEDYRKLLAAEKTVDAVVIASGQRWHVPMGKAAMLPANVAAFAWLALGWQRHARHERPAATA